MQREFEISILGCQTQNTMRTKQLYPSASKGFLHFLFPELCLACDQHFAVPGDVLCVHCNGTLPILQYHHQPENPFTIRFWGRLPLQSGAALFLFTKDSKVQNLLHSLKYDGRWQIGVELGRKFGWMLRSSRSFSHPDVIVPVPLHFRKEWERGYNQSAMFAEGLSASMGITSFTNALERTAYTETQTHKSRIERLENVRDVFAVRQKDDLMGKHVLLVDDVLTTGSTLESCALKILEVPGTKVSMATLAIANHL